MHVFLAEEAGPLASDRGLAYGDGLFETIRMQGRQGTLLSRHVARLVQDAGRLGISVSRTAVLDAFHQGVARFATDFGDRPWVLKLVLTRGGGGRGYRPDPKGAPHLVVVASPAPEAPPENGVVVDFSSVPLTVNPLLAGIKSLNRLEQVLAARALQGDLFEVIQSNSEGHLVEGTRTNLLVRSVNGWLTPPTAQLAVAGVMRQWVLERLRARGEPVAERPVLPGDVLGDDGTALYLLNSVLGVVPVRNLAGHDLPVDKGLATICDLLETLE